MRFLIVLSCISMALAMTRYHVDSENRTMVERISFELPPPPLDEESTARMARNVITSWITMPLDHFDPQNQDTFQMRYMTNEEFFGDDGSPIFIFVGGEWTIAAGWLMTGNMYEMARENRGYQVYTEHRYYGATRPFTSHTAENLRFLNVDQALADLAYFIMSMKAEARFANSDVILYGGSYAANMALWFKQRYPHLVKGVIASSGPIKAQVDYTGYLEMVDYALLTEGGQECVDTIKQGIDDTAAALATAAGRLMVESVFQICGNINYENPFELGYFSGWISWTLSGAVQSARPGTLTTLCNNFASTLYGLTPMQKVAGYLKAAYNIGANNCIGINYENYINSGIASFTDSKAWYYQTCTEYAYFQIAPSSGSVFDSLVWLSVDFYTDYCKRVYDPTFDEHFIRDSVDRVNLIFGALEPEVNNTINIHGDIDPWRALGVYDAHISETSPTINVPRASHCFDMQPWLQVNTIQMTQAQQFARRRVADWLRD